tara:strand:+ start:1956 stop:2804 length:849 start_codon:yes stop_codon:yes gene_type:complete
MLDIDKTYHLNCIAGMEKLDEDCIDLVVTSPPYDQLRTYNDSSKWSMDIFYSVAAQLNRVLKPGGVIMWNVNDATVDGSETGTSFRQALHFKDVCGLRLHDTMIYEKTGIAFASGPKSVRYSQAFEYCFILSKGKPKTTNIICDKPNKWAGSTSWGKARSRKKTGELDIRENKTNPIKEFGARNNIWRIKNCGGFGQSNKESYKHPATMPEELARGHIQTWTNEGDLVLDPFMGSGTTAQVSLEEKRHFIGFEIDDTYYDMCVNRVRPMQDNLLTRLNDIKT